MCLLDHDSPELGHHLVACPRPCGTCGCWVCQKTWATHFKACSSFLPSLGQQRPAKANQVIIIWGYLFVFLRRHPSVSPNWAIAIQRQMRQGSSIRTKEASRRVLVRKRSTRHDLPHQSGFEVWQDMEGWQAALEGEHHKGNGEVRVFFAFFGIKTI